MRVLCVQDVAQATEALQAVHRQQNMWLRFKAAMLAHASRSLRQELVEAKSHAAELEVATVQTEVAGLHAMLQQQQDFASSLAQVCQVGGLCSSLLKDCAHDTYVHAAGPHFSV